MSSWRTPRSRRATSRVLVLGRGLRRVSSTRSTRTCSTGPRRTGLGSEALGRRTGARGDRPEPLPGVEVVGYFTADLGIGEAARQVVTSLEEAAIPLSTRTYTRTLEPARARRGSTGPAPEGGRYDTALICVNADMLPTLARTTGRRSSRIATRIGLWFWELAQWPETMTEACARDTSTRSGCPASSTQRDCDESPTSPCAWCRIRPMRPHGATCGSPSSREDFHFPVRLRLLQRARAQEPCGSGRGFRHRHSRSPVEARLVIKTINGAERPADRERLLYAVGDRPDIALVERYLDRDELDGLMWNADCYVSLHRSEGFGQTLAEMMAIGKPGDRHSLLGKPRVHGQDQQRPGWSDLGPGAVGQRALPGRHRSGLGATELKQAARAMRQMVEDPELRERIGTEAARTIARDFSTEALGRAASLRLGQIRIERDATTRRARLSASGRRLLDQARGLVRPSATPSVESPAQRRGEALQVLAIPTG